MSLSDEGDQEKGVDGLWSLGLTSFPKFYRSTFWEVSQLLGVNPGKQGSPLPGLCPGPLAARGGPLSWTTVVVWMSSGHEGCLVFALCFPCRSRAMILSVNCCEAVGFTEMHFLK